MVKNADPRDRFLADSKKFSRDRAFNERDWEN